MEDRIIEFEGFSPEEERMIVDACHALQDAGYDISIVTAVLRGSLPRDCGGMTLGESEIVLDSRALCSQDMLNHVLEEEVMHLWQRRAGKATSFGPGTADELEEEVDAERKFQRPTGTR